MNLLYTEWKFWATVRGVESAIFHVLCPFFNDQRWTQCVLCLVMVNIALFSSYVMWLNYA